MTPLIINRPDLQTFRQRFGQRLITTFFWILFFFFMRPLIGIVGWVFGVELFTHIMIDQGGYHALLDLLAWYLGIIVLMGLLLEGWSLYNLLRYGHHEKRLYQPEALTLEAQADHFGIEPGLLRRLQRERRVVLYHDEHGRLLDGRD